MTPANVLDACRLEVAPEQERFVSPVAEMSEDQVVGELELARARPGPR
ncbi:hypothetical protein ACWCQM_03890 [Streptomyces sp. NPDC002125]